MLPRTEKLFDIIWSPLKEDEFIVYGSDLYLYKVKNSASTTSKYKNSLKSKK